MTKLEQRDLAAIGDADSFVQGERMPITFEKMHGPWHLKKCNKQKFLAISKEIAAFQAAHEETALSG